MKSLLRSNKKPNEGFTLIELMIVVGIIAILSSVAVPAYQAYVLEGRRAEGKAFAMDIASRQERHFTQHGSYATALTGTGTNALDMPSASSENGSYAGSTTGGASFTVTVDPTFTDAECDNLTLTNIGVRGENGTGTVADCW